MLAWDDDEVPDSHKQPEMDMKENFNADAVIAQLISACQQDQFEAVFDHYGRLRRIEAPLYEGVYKMMVLCCLRTRHLDMALEVVDWMKAAGHRPSAFLFLEMLEAYAAAGDAGKVQCVWSAVDETRLQRADVGSILHRVVMHLLTLRAPTMAMQVLEDGAEREIFFAPDEFASFSAPVTR
jgi:pentatricopeptide repeat protein